MVNIFQDNTKTVPKSDEQIVRVDMEQLDIGGRKSHLPAGETQPGMAVAHVPNAGTKG